MARYPNLRKHARDLIGGDGAARFGFGLDLLIDGFAEYGTF